MSEEDMVALTRRLEREFDAAFAQPIDEDAEPTLALVLLRIGDEVVAARVSELRRVGRCPPIVAVPSDVPACLGVAAVRGVVVGMYALADLVGIGARPSSLDRAWYVTCGDGTIGLVVDAIPGYVDVAASTLRRGDDASPHRPSGEILETSSGPRQLVDIAEIVTRLHGPSSAFGAREEDTTWLA